MHCDFCVPVACFCNTAARGLVNNSEPASHEKEPRWDVLKFLGNSTGTNQRYESPMHPLQAGNNIMELIGGTPRTGSYSQRSQRTTRFFNGPHSSMNMGSGLPPGSFSINPIDGKKIRPLAGDITPGMGMGSPSHQQVYPQGVDEEAGPLSAQDKILYTQCEIARRMQNPTYALACREQTFDLTISIPIQLPYSTVVVDVLSGENYYGKRREFEDLLSAPHSDHSLFGRGVDACNTLSARLGLATDIPQLLEVKDPTTNKYDSACDTWASFLRIKLGTVYNVREHQLKLVAENLRSALSKTVLDNPMTFIASGIFCLDRDGVIVDTPSGCGNYQRNEGEYQYVTQLRPQTNEDRNSMIRIRQKIKSFANRLVTHFGYARDPCTNSSVTVPFMHVELDPNFASVRLNAGTIQVVIREYSPILPQWISQMVWNYQNGKFINTSQSVIKSKVETTEIRLEYMKGRMVDPRWPKELVIGRRIGGYVVGESIINMRNLTRFVFSRKTSPLSFLYRAGFLEYMQDKEYPHDSQAKKEDIQSCMLCTKFHKEVASHLKYEPSAGISEKIHHDDKSPTQAPIPVIYNRRRTPIAKKPTLLTSLSGDIRLNVNAVTFQPTTKARDLVDPLKKVSKETNDSPKKEVNKENNTPLIKEVNNQSNEPQTVEIEASGK